MAHFFLLQVLLCGIFCNPRFYSGKFDTLGRPKSFFPGVTKCTRDI